MLSVKSFAFNPFQENTYILFNEFKECIIIDPGMFNAHEEMEFSAFIADNQLTPKLLLNTHCHIDHILGNYYCFQKYQLITQCHLNEMPVLAMGKATASVYEVGYAESPKPVKWIADNEIIKFGNDTLQAIYTPGHSPGSLSFYSVENNFVISGDVLFYQSIGRADLPGGDFATLIHSIKTRLFTLPEETKVYSGHGPATIIGHEKVYNPYVG
ncbi:MAG: MBL fold metallo-hydrolase [bacterium]|nr:MBL fold metallo-hydrolase [bacterium]